MFSLIITIISIALVAALALATIYYGGTAFNRGSADAVAAQLINEGQQINGAVAMNRADAASGAAAAVTDLAGLVTANYLAQVPTAWASATTIANGFAVTTAAVAADVCTRVNTRAGHGADVTNATGAYGCVSKAGEADLGKVYFRF